MTRLVNIHREQCDVCIMRPSEYGNPVSLGKRCPVCAAVHTRVEGVQALLCYSELLLPRLRTDRDFVRGLHAMEGKTLGCVCAPAHCHGDLLLAYIDGYSERVAMLCGAGSPPQWVEVPVLRPWGVAREAVQPVAIAHRSGLTAVANHVEWLREQLPAQRQLL